MSEQSTTDPTTFLYLEDDPLLLDLHADIADDDARMELVTTTGSKAAAALLAEHEFDYVILGGGRADPTVVEFARDLRRAYPDLTLVLYTWEPPDGIGDAGLTEFDAVVKKQVGAEQTIQLLARIKRLDD
ncbi:MAG: hypothetical protein ABEH86_01910 [Haloarcula sp.]